MDWTEDTIEKFVKDHKDKFDKYTPEKNHNEHFLVKLSNRFKKFISIVPHIIKVGIITIFIFTTSFIIWHNYICPPLTHISMKYWKVEHLYLYHIHRMTHAIYKLDRDEIDKKKFTLEMQKLNISYKLLKKELKKNPTLENIIKMLEFYRTKLNILNTKIIELRKWKLIALKYQPAF
jgi:hypothetical protein